MILHCEKCDTRYLVDPSSIGREGRTVRCAKCGHDWFQAPEEKAPEPLPDFMMLDDEAPAAEGGGLPALAQKKGTPAALKWGVGGLLFLVILLSLVAFRAVISSHVGALRPLYDAVGLTDSSGLALADLTFDKIPSSKRDRYTVSGKIVNETNAPRVLPILRITLLDEAGNALQYWDLSDEKILAPKEVVPFTSGKLETRFTRGTHFNVELGNAFELYLRH